VIAPVRVGIGAQGEPVHPAKVGRRGENSMCGRTRSHRGPAGSVSGIDVTDRGLSRTAWDRFESLLAGYSSLWDRLRSLVADCPSSVVAISTLLGGLRSPQGRLRSPVDPFPSPLVPDRPHFFPAAALFGPDRDGLVPIRSRCGPHRYPQAPISAQPVHDCRQSVPHRYRRGALAGKLHPDGAPIGARSCDYVPRRDGIARKPLPLAR
jgi:hypothetical protein